LTREQQDDRNYESKREYDNQREQERYNESRPAYEQPGCGGTCLK
jgi:hypothetical protein